MKCIEYIGACKTEEVFSDLYFRFLLSVKKQQYQASLAHKQQKKPLNKTGLRPKEKKQCF
jgi:hypothetical protein